MELHNERRSYVNNWLPTHLKKYVYKNKYSIRHFSIKFLLGLFALIGILLITFNLGAGYVVAIYGLTIPNCNPQTGSCNGEMRGGLSTQVLDVTTVEQSGFYINLNSSSPQYGFPTTDTITNMKAHEENLSNADGDRIGTISGT